MAGDTDTYHGSNLDRYYPHGVIGHATAHLCENCAVAVVQLRLRMYTRGSHTKTKGEKMKIFNSLDELAKVDLFTDPALFRDQPFTVDGQWEAITHGEYEDLFSLVVDLVENVPSAEFLSVQVTPHHIIVVIAANGTRVTRVIRPLTPATLTLIIKDGLTPETPSPSHCRCGVQSAPKHTPTMFEPPVRAVPDLNNPHGPMAESHHYIARRAHPLM